MLLSANSTLRLTAAATNETTTFYGGLLDLSGRDILIPQGSKIELVSQPENGGAPLIRCHSLNLATGGTIDASGHGYASLNGPGKAGSTYGGGGYGGKGGSSGGGPVYGTPHGPLFPGSGGHGPGGTPSGGGRGGGLVWIETAEATIDGNITANGVKGITKSGSGSGGGVYIACNSFYGNGTISADGADGNVSASSGAGGGGGRIAIWTDVPDYTRLRYWNGITSPVTATPTHKNFYGTLSVAPGSGSGSAAESGTAFFYTLRIPNTTVLIIR